MKKVHFFIAFLLVLGMFLNPQNTKAQAVAIKKWKGAYPEMNGSYPLTFIAFKGWLIPVPHVFIRTWPTHYYMEVGAVPVTDSEEISGNLQTGVWRMFLKASEQRQMKGRHGETTEIRDQTQQRNNIAQRMYQARNEQVEDIYNIGSSFVRLYRQLRQLKKLHHGKALQSILQEEADQLLLQFFMVNLMETSPGEKLKAFSSIGEAVNRLLGETDYATNKLHFFNRFGQEVLPYAFLTQ